MDEIDQTKFKCQQDMCKENIKNRSDFRKWAIKNHPDKGGNQNVFKKINECVQNDTFCTEDFCSPEMFKILNEQISKLNHGIDFFKDYIQGLKRSLKTYLKDRKEIIDYEPEMLDSYKKDMKEMEEKIEEMKEIIKKYKEELKPLKRILKICEKIKKTRDAIEKLDKEQKKPLLIEAPPKKERKSRKPCKETQMRDPMTCKCIVDRTKKKCPPEKTLNPLTGRCLSNYDPKKKC